MSLSHPVSPCVGLRRQFRWPRDGPVEPALFQHLFHAGRIRNNSPEEQSAKEVRWRDDRVLKQESHGLDHNASNSGTWHGARQRDGELPQKVCVPFRYGHPRPEG